LAAVPRIVLLDGVQFDGTPGPLGAGPVVAYTPCVTPVRISRTGRTRRAYAMR
jgi:hypothetical protein